MTTADGWGYGVDHEPRTRSEHKLKTEREALVLSRNPLIDEIRTTEMYDRRFFQRYWSCAALDQTERHNEEITEKDRVISELKKQLDLQHLLNREMLEEMLEDNREEMLDPRFLEMSKNNEDLDEEELKPEKKEAKEVELFFKEIEEKGNEIYKKQL